MEKWLEEMAEVKAEKALDEELVRHPEMVSQKESLLESKKAQAMEELEKEWHNLTHDISLAKKQILSWLEGLPQEKRQAIEAEFISFFDDSIPISNATLESIYPLGYAKQTEGEHGDAKALFRYLTFLDPSVCDFWIALGNSQFNLKQFAEAKESFIQARDAEPNRPEGYYCLALCALEQHDLMEARVYCEKALALTHEEKWTTLLHSILESVKKGGKV